MDANSQRIPGVPATPAVNWAQALDDHARWLRTVLSARSGGDRQAVEDLFQEVALAAIRQQAPLADPAKVAPWLYQLAVRQALQYRRKSGRRRRVLEAAQQVTSGGSAATDPLSWLLADERRQLVRQALQRLRPRDRELLLLKYTEDWSYQELARHLGIRPHAVDSRLQRARQKLREQLARCDLQA